MKTSDFILLAGVGLVVYLWFFQKTAPTTGWNDLPPGQPPPSDHPVTTPWGVEL